MISIVIPAHNAERHIGEAVESVLRQTRHDWELIIVDDGSTDGTVGVCTAYQERDKRVRIVRQSAQGVSAARNAGCAAASASAEYVAFLDADDTWEPDALETLTRPLERDARLVAASALARYVNADGRSVRPGEAESGGANRWGVVGRSIVPWPAERPTSFEVIAVSNTIATGAILVRRGPLGSAPFDTSLNQCEDWDAWVRLCLAGDIALVNRVVLNYRQHGASASADRRALEAGRREVRRRLLSDARLTDEQRRIVSVAARNERKVPRYTYLLRARESLTSGQWLRAAQMLRRAARAYAQSLRLT